MGHGGWCPHCEGWRLSTKSKSQQNFEMLEASLGKIKLCFGIRESRRRRAWITRNSTAGLGLGWAAVYWYCVVEEGVPASAWDDPDSTRGVWVSVSPSAKRAGRDLLSRVHSNSTISALMGSSLRPWILRVLMRIYLYNSTFQKPFLLSPLNSP